MMKLSMPISSSRMMKECPLKTSDRWWTRTRLRHWPLNHCGCTPNLKRCSCVIPVPCKNSTQVLNRRFYYFRVNQVADIMVGEFTPYGHSDLTVLRRYLALTEQVLTNSPPAFWRCG